MGKPYKEQSLFGKQVQETRDQEPVECLGMSFENDEARREYFLEKLRERLRDPELRKIEGFPIGSDEDILALSDPPYYTACPNPWVSDFIAHWRTEQRGLRTELKEGNNASDSLSPQHSVLSTQSSALSPTIASRSPWM